jgi:hypothetical protein
MTRQIITCGLCPFRLELGTETAVRYWWCPDCGCYNTYAPEGP